MQVRVLVVEADAVVLAAALAPNINHRETVFGGSASALAILAAWSLVHTRLAAERLAPRLVIQRNTMDYDLPIAGDFTARSALAAEAEWPRFTRVLARKGRARIAVRSLLETAGLAAGRFEGEFVALAAPAPEAVQASA
jgi:thioesterase domain-containing protein